jgi:hypothetical protein
MELGGPQADIQHAGDLPVRESRRGQAEHFDLACGEMNLAAPVLPRRTSARGHAHDCRRVT